MCLGFVGKEKFQCSEYQIEKRTYPYAHTHTHTHIYIYIYMIQYYIYTLFNGYCYCCLYIVIIQFWTFTGEIFRACIKAQDWTPRNTVEYPISLGTWHPYLFIFYWKTWSAFQFSQGLPKNVHNISLWWIPRTKAGDAELWCFLWSVTESTVE